MTGETAHVHFVDDQILDRHLQRTVALPVEVVKNDPRAVLEPRVPVWRLSPYVTAADGAGIRIEQHGRGVEAVEGRLLRLGMGKAVVHPEAVFDLLIVEVEHGHCEDVADAELPPHRLSRKRLGEHSAKGNLDQWLRCALLQYHQDAIVGVS